MQIDMEFFRKIDEYISEFNGNHDVCVNKSQVESTIFVLRRRFRFWFRSKQRFYLIPLSKRIFPTTNRIAVQFFCFISLLVNIFLFMIFCLYFSTRLSRHSLIVGGILKVNFDCRAQFPIEHDEERNASIEQQYQFVRSLVWYLQKRLDDQAFTK